MGLNQVAHRPLRPLRQCLNRQSDGELGNNCRRELNGVQRLQLHHCGEKCRSRIELAWNEDGIQRFVCFTFRLIGFEKGVTQRRRGP